MFATPLSADFERGTTDNVEFRWEAHDLLIRQQASQGAVRRHANLEHDRDEVSDLDPYIRGDRFGELSQMYVALAEDVIEISQPQITLTVTWT